jgi:hypothetical protein
MQRSGGEVLASQGRYARRIAARFENPLAWLLRDIDALEAMIDALDNEPSLLAVSPFGGIPVYDRGQSGANEARRVREPVKPDAHGTSSVRRAERTVGRQAEPNPGAATESGATTPVFSLRRQRQASPVPPRSQSKRGTAQPEDGKRPRRERGASTERRTDKFDWKPVNTHDSGGETHDPQSGMSSPHTHYGDADARAESVTEVPAGQTDVLSLIGEAANALLAIGRTEAAENARTGVLPRSDAPRGPETVTGASAPEGGRGVTDVSPALTRAGVPAPVSETLHDLASALYEGLKAQGSNSRNGATSESVRQSKGQTAGSQNEARGAADRGSWTFSSPMQALSEALDVPRRDAQSAQRDAISHAGAEAVHSFEPAPWSRRSIAGYVDFDDDLTGTARRTGANRARRLPGRISEFSMSPGDELDADIVASLVSQALAEQARRHGVDI